MDYDEDPDPHCRSCEQWRRKNRRIEEMLRLLQEFTDEYTEDVCLDYCDEGCKHQRARVLLAAHQPPPSGEQ